MKKATTNLVPNIQNPTPDYYCTWQTQLYATCDGKPVAQRENITEKGLFAQEKPYGWAYFYENTRNDLFIVMDDSWDVPLENYEPYYGSLQLDKTKFPESTADGRTNAEAMKVLADRIKALGWKGLGGWVCAQESELFSEGKTPEEYWTERLKEAHEAGFSYWKVDWGKNMQDPEWRKMLTNLGKKYAPNLTIEQSMIKEIIPVSDVYRTYDVPAIMSIPMTMEKLREFSAVGTTKEGYLGLVNCEDEAYVAAAGGYAMGIMRHPYSGAFVNGKPDMSFPAVHRNLKTKMCEVTRAARWHRIAPAFGVSEEGVHISDEMLRDTWVIEDQEAEIEAWWMWTASLVADKEGDMIPKSACAAISRNIELPKVTPDANGDIPYVVASRNPNGAVSIVTLGRTRERAYWIPLCDITLDAGDADTVGVFGEYASLTLNVSRPVSTVLMQDLAADEALDVTEDVVIGDGTVTIPGALIRKIGTMAQPEGDTSEPGVVVRLA